MAVDSFRAWQYLVVTSGLKASLFMALYLVLALLFWIKGVVLTPVPSASYRLITALLLILAVNSVFQLDTLASILLRAWARQEGWYYIRRPIQYICVAVALGVAVVYWSNMGSRDPDSSALENTFSLGLSLLVLLVVVRTISAHHVDSVMNMRVLGISINRMVEFGFISLTAFGTFHLKQPPEHLLKPTWTSRHV